MVLQNVDKAQIKLKSRKDNVAGVTLPIFETYIDGGDSESMHASPPSPALLSLSRNKQRNEQSVALSFLGDLFVTWFLYCGGCKLDPSHLFLSHVFTTCVLFPSVWSDGSSKGRSAADKVQGDVWQGGQAVG